MARGGGSKTLTIRFIADIARATRDIDRLEKKLNKLGGKPLGDEAKGSGNRGFISTILRGGGTGGVGDTGLTNLSRASNLLTSAFNSLNPAIIAATVAFFGLKHAFEQAFHFGNIIEQSKVVLKSIYGSEGKAVNTLRGMREFSRKTQFQPEEVVGATTMMAKYNVDPFKKGTHGLAGDKNVMDIMAGLAAMPGMGGKPLGLDRVVNSVIAGRDIRPIKALGPEAMAAYEVAKKAGTSGSPAFINAMLTELAKVPKILALANEQADAMKGLWSTITGYAEEFWMDFTGAGEEKGVVTFWSQIKDILFDIRASGEAFIKYIGPYVTEFGTYVGALIKFVWDTLKQIARVIGPIIIPYFKIWIQNVRVIWEVLKITMKTVVSLLNIMITLISIPFRLLAALTGSANRIENIVNSLMEFVTGLQVTFQLFSIFLDGIVNSISKAVDNLIDDFKMFFDELGRMGDEFLKKHPWIKTLLNNMSLDNVPVIGPMRQAIKASEELGKTTPKFEMEMGYYELDPFGIGKKGKEMNAARYQKEREEKLLPQNRQKSGDIIINNWGLKLIPQIVVPNDTGRPRQ